MTKEWVWRWMMLACLVWIALELHGNPWRHVEDAASHVRTIGRNEETPAPGSGGGLLNANAEELERTADLLSNMPPASAASRR